MAPALCSIVGVIGWLLLSAVEGACDASSCELQYVKALEIIDSRFAKRVSSFLCPYENVVRTSDAVKLIVASSGTTGSRTFAEYLFSRCSLMVGHWQHVLVHLSGGQEHWWWRAPPAEANGTRVSANLPLYEAFLNRKPPNEEVDAFMRQADLAAALEDGRRHYGGTPFQLDAVMDFPVDLLFYDLYKAFPNALFVLLDRNATAWAESRLRNHPTADPPVLRGFSTPETEIYPLQFHAAVFDAHRRLVKCLVPPERLLVTSYFTDMSMACSASKVQMETANFIERAARGRFKCQPWRAQAKRCKVDILETA